MSVCVCVSVCVSVSVCVCVCVSVCECVCVCVWNFSREVKLVPLLQMQGIFYFILLEFSLMIGGGMNLSFCLVM